jgi:hypothetical protein
MNGLIFAALMVVVIAGFLLLIPPLYAFPHHPWVRLPKWPARVYERYMDWWLEKELEWQERDR